MVVLLLFSYSYLLQSHAVCSFAYAEFASMVPVSGECIRIRMLLLAKL
jgi:hypothetical protein